MTKSLPAPDWLYEELWDIKLKLRRKNRRVTLRELVEELGREGLKKLKEKYGVNENE